MTSTRSKFTTSARRAKGLEAKGTRATSDPVALTRPTSLLTRGDAVTLAAIAPDQKWDAVITDFPYGNGTDYGGTYQDTPENLSALIAAVLPQLRRIAKRVVIFPGVENLSLYPKPTWTLGWFIPGGLGYCVWGFPSWQPILVYGADPYLANGLGRRPDAFALTTTSGTSIHPCPKPLPVMKWVVERTSLANERLLDPLMGRGTTVMASLLTGRSCDGWEINPEFFAEAEANVEQAQLQLLSRHMFMPDGGRKRQLEYVIKEA